MSIQSSKERLRSWRRSYPDMSPYVIREERKMAQLERLAEAKAQLKPGHYQTVLQNGDSLKAKWFR